MASSLVLRALAVVVAAPPEGADTGVLALGGRNLLNCEFTSDNFPGEISGRNLLHPRPSEHE